MKISKQVKSFIMLVAHKKYVELKTKYHNVVGSNLSKLWSKVLKWAWNEYKSMVGL